MVPPNPESLPPASSPEASDPSPAPSPPSPPSPPSSPNSPAAEASSPLAGWRRLLNRSLFMGIAVVTGFFFVYATFLFFYQRKMIYYPRRYQEIERRGLPAGTVELEYTTSQGVQRAFYLPPRETAASSAASAVPGAALPGALWVLFNGNASTALDWLDIAEKARARRPEIAFLLVDYPGYGFSEGKPTRETVREASAGAYAALAAHLGVEPEDLDGRLHVLGFSLGAATGLDFAVERPALRRVVLMAPFTSTLDMARRMVVWPLYYLLLDRYDNRARLGELVARPDPPALDIFHGEADDIVSVSMGRELAEAFPGRIVLHAVPGADHNFLPMAIEGRLVELLADSVDGSFPKTTP